MLNSARYVPPATPPPRGVGAVRKVIGGLVLAALLGLGGYGVSVVLKEVQLKRARQEAATQRVSDSADALLKDRMKTLDGKENGHSEVERLTDFQKSLEAAGQEHTGGKARMLKALAQFSKEMTERAATFQAITKQVTEAGIFKFTAVGKKEELTMRRDLVRSYLKESGELQHFQENSEKQVRAALVAEQVEGAMLEDVIVGFKKGAAHLGVQIETRRTEQEYLKVALKILDLLDAEWGHWQGSPASKLTFASDALVERYKALAADLSKTQATYLEAERAMIVAMKKANPDDGVVR
jgi:hypothetical protein